MNLDNHITKENTAFITWILWIIGWGFLAGISVLFLLIQFHILQLPSLFRQCIFRKYFSIYCPSCGGTRAVTALLHGQIQTAFYYHSGACLTIFWILIFQFSNLAEFLTNHKYPVGIKFRLWHIFVILGLFVANAVYKNICW